jgi:hypothetical protein
MEKDCQIWLATSLIPIEASNPQVELINLIVCPIHNVKGKKDDKLNQ